jgi:glutamine cyclotransferase
LPNKFFAEGSTLAANDFVYQLTYMEKKVLQWKLNKDDYSLKLVETKSMPEKCTMK